MSFCDGLDPSIFCRKMEKTRPMMEEMDGEEFISRQRRHFRFDISSWKHFSLFVPWLGVQTIMFPAEGQV